MGSKSIISFQHPFKVCIRHEYMKTLHPREAFHVSFMSRRAWAVGCSLAQQPVIRAPLHTGSSLTHLDTLIFRLLGKRRR